MRTTYATTTGDLLTIERDGTDDWTFGVYVGERLAGLVYKETDVSNVGRETWWKRSDTGERYTSTWRAAAAMTGLTVTGEADDDGPVCPRCGAPDGHPHYNVHTWHDLQRTNGSWDLCPRAPRG